MTRLDLTPVFRTAVGFDRMANLVESMIAGGIENQSNWPPTISKNMARTPTAFRWPLPVLVKTTSISPSMTRC